MLTERDLDLLSAYLDGTLNNTERAALETRLQSDTELSRELASLRATVDLVKTLPTLRAPRDFTLTPQMVRRRPSILTSAAFSALSAAAAVVLLVLGSAFFLNTSLPPSNMAGNQVAALATQPNTQLDTESPQAAQELAPGETGAGAPALEEDESSPTLERTLNDGMMAAPTLLIQGTLGAPPADMMLMQATGSVEAYSFALPETQADVDGESLDDAADADVLEQQRSVTATEQSFAAAQESASEMPAPLASNSGAAADASSAMVQQPTQPPTASPKPTDTPTMTATPTPSPTPSPTASAIPTATALPTLTPQPTMTPTPVIEFLEGVNSAGIGLGLIVLAVLLLVLALVTTIIRRRR